MEELKEVPWFVIYDESFNHELPQEQKDFIIRYFKQGK